MKTYKFMPFLLLIGIINVKADNLTPLEINSSLLSNDIDETSQPITILDRTDILPNKSLGENIGMIPGISNSDYGPAVGQPVIRGLGGNRVKFLMSGQSVNDLSYFSADHPIQINLDNANHIEILKGPSSLFGYSGTTGGVINVISDSITDRLYDEEKIKISRSFGSASEGYSNNFLFKKNMGNASLFISYDKKDYHNYDLAEGSLYEEGALKHNLANSDVADKSALFGLSVLREWGYIGFSFEDTKGTYGIPYHAEEEEEEEEEGEHRIFSTHKTDNYKIKGRIDSLAFANSLDFSFGNSNSSIKEHEEDGSFKLLNNNSMSTSLKFNLDDGNIKKRLMISYLHAKSPMSSGAYIPTSESYERSIAYFTTLNAIGYDIDFVTRYDNNERSTASKNYEDSAFSLSLNSYNKLTDNLSYNLGYSHVSRSPTMAELYADGKHGPTNRYEKGDNNLNREVSRNIDFGINYDLKDTTISFNLYQNDINDYIYLRDLGTTTYDGEHQDANWSQKSAVIQGYELSMQNSYLIGERELLVTLSRDDISGVFDDDTYIPRIPSAKNVIDFTLMGIKNEKYSLSFLYSEQQADIASNETRTNSYIDLSMRYSNKFKMNNDYDINLNLFAENILDKTRRNHASFVKAHVPLSGANFGFNISLDSKF